MSKHKFIIESDDDNEDIEIINEQRIQFIDKYNKSNNRLFLKTKYYSINDYYSKITRLEKKNKSLRSQLIDTYGELKLKEENTPEDIDKIGRCGFSL